MNYSVFIRPLKITDAKISYKWRNDQSIWEFTEFKPAGVVTKAMEMQWLKKALTVKNDYRFAICIKETGEYIGNVQLINVKNKTAHFHLFIGDSAFWGKGIGKEATSLILHLGFGVLDLCDVMLKVHHKHIAAQKVYEKMGFQIIDDKSVFIKMILTKKYYNALIKINQRNFLDSNGTVLFNE